MEKVSIGRTGLKINPLIYGTLPLGPLQADLTAENGGALIRHALERGVNMLDTAELYGTYGHIKAAIRDYQGEVILATKTHAEDGRTARLHVERALRELGLERLDIVHVHAGRLLNPFICRAGVLEELVMLQYEGKIAHLGIASHRVEVVRQAAARPEIAVVHPLINRIGMGILDGSAEEMGLAIDEVAQAGKGVYAMKALAGGNLIAEARTSLAYVRDLPGVDAVAVGMLSQQEIEANVALFSGQEPDAPVWAELESRRRTLQIMEKFCKGCGACLPACTNGALRLVSGKVQVDRDKCILCGYCAAACPEFIIRVI